MNRPEVAALLAHLQHIDNRHVADDTVEAWAPILDDITYQDAQQAIIWHKKEKPGVYIDLAVIRTIARNLAAARTKQHAIENPTPNDADPYSGKNQHCGRVDCQCTHTNGCDRGWILTREHQAAPCRTCNYRRWYILTAGHNRDQATRLLRDKTDGAPTPQEQTQGHKPHYQGRTR